MMLKPLPQILIFSICTLLVGSCRIVAGQSNGINVKLHVTSVSRNDDPEGCDGVSGCQTTKITVQAYSAGTGSGSRTEYVLTCDEMISGKPPRLALDCGNVHADHDYDARIVGNNMSFWPIGKYTPPPYHGLFKIVSEKETR